MVFGGGGGGGGGVINEVGELDRSHIAMGL